MLFPPIFFYTVLFRRALNIPIFDEYDALLNFLNELVQLKTISARTSYFLASQHCEFKLFFMHGLGCLQYYLSGHIDFRLLSAIGNGFVLLLAILLWKMFLPHRDFASRLALFIPVSWLIFQFQYFECLNWAIGGLQHVAGLVFSLGAICLLVRGERWAYYNAAAFFILAVSSDGAGLLLVPIGLLILALGRHYRRAAGWLVISAACIFAYAYRYNVMQSGAHAHRSIFSVAMGFRPDYVIAFMGCAASYPFGFKAGGLLLGSLLCIFFAYMTWRGYIRKNPTVACCVLFLLFSSLGAAGLRSDFGASHLPSRYTLYSVLFLAFAWFAIAEDFLQDSRVSLLDNGIFLGAVFTTILFSLSMDFIGFSLMGARDRELVKAMAEFEHPTLTESSPSPSPPVSASLPGEEPNPWNLHARAVMIQSIKLGIYRPPPL